MPAIVLPNLGYGTREGTILQWLKALEEAVQPGEPVVEVAMEKTVHVLTAEAEGVLLAAWAPAGAIVPEAYAAWRGGELRRRHAEVEQDAVHMAMEATCGEQGL